MSIINSFKTIPTTCISDAMTGLNNLNSSIKPLKEEYKVVGRAFTVKMPVGDNLVFLKAIKEAKPGDVLVVDAKGDTYRAIAGDFIVGLAQTLGINGIVVDGVIRDVVGVKKLNFPVFCKGTAVAASGKSGQGELNVPISCGGTTVHPGDIIVGDADGVVVIPKEHEQTILTKATEKVKFDELRDQKVSGNRDEVINYLNDFLSKS
ncbi:RraA family protein [Priestia flexa]|uniref:Putative 4-hydroxy-4-methyl-2-oxoglutarate aldolase n=2 Tax=Priestia TaxID=2800373 RepID=A0A0V8JQU8_9BACI|nr:MULTISPECIES: RraA family protein [Bacillaceae]AQX54841.1 regulator [Priestia flexa]KSU89465.1 regulator [Priestia veravalensis]KZB91221.1 regulator [Bacillus sp. VT 712]MCA1202571.1 RraA family protein [Priestia flexa]MCM3067557.1 RraA family protein [Priestia flexa]